MDQPPQKQPIFTANVARGWPVFALIAVFVALHIASGFDGTRRFLYEYFAFAPYDYWGLLNGQATRVWTGATSAFLHGDVMHLAMNSAAMVGFGQIAHRVMGTGRFFVFFLLTAALAALAYALVRPDGGLMIGASGALFAMWAVWHRVEIWQRRLSGAAYWRKIAECWGVVLVINLLILLIEPRAAWDAHLGGYVAGWLLAPLLVNRALVRP